MSYNKHNNWYKGGKRYRDIKCTEQFVFQPPTLKSIASAKILDEDILDFDFQSTRFFRKIATDPVVVIKRSYSCGDYHFVKQILPANKFTLEIDIDHAYPYSDDSQCIPVSQVNDNARIERATRVRKQLLPYFESKKSKIEYID